MQAINNVQLTEGDTDKWRWKGDNTETCSVRSTYALTQETTIHIMFSCRHY